MVVLRHIILSVMGRPAKNLLQVGRPIQMKPTIRDIDAVKYLMEKTGLKAGQVVRTAIWRYAQNEGWSLETKEPTYVDTHQNR